MTMIYIGHYTKTKRVKKKLNLMCKNIYKSISIQGDSNEYLKYVYMYV